MKFLVGFSPDQGGKEALALGAVLARSCGGSVVVCNVIPETWGHPSMARVDAEYAEFLSRHARAALDNARKQLGKGTAAEFVTRSAPSAREGLIQTAADVGADCIVLGSARSAPLGRFAEGNVTSGVLHSASLPVAVAPRGYAPSPRASIKRLTCAYSGARNAHGLVERSAALSQKFGLELRLATFVVRDKQMYPTGAGYSAENLVSNQLRRQATEAQKQISTNWASPVKLTSVIGDDKSWKGAVKSIGWKSEEVMVVGSSSLGPILRVFLGSNSGKIVASSPVPCLLLPRSGSEEA